MPVIRVMDRKMIEKARPALNTLSQVAGIQVSMDTMKAASSTYQAVRMIRSSWGARSVAVVGGVGGSTEASGSFVSSRLRMPGTNSRAATRTMKGNDGSTAADSVLLAGR